MKKHLVLFSGGLDSTFLLYKLLKDGHDVTTFYVDIQNNSEKVQVELLQRSLILEKLENEFPGKTNDLGVVMSIDVKRIDRDNIPLPQPNVWTLAAAMCCPKGIDEISIGYVMHDSALSYLTEIKRLFTSYSAFLRTTKFPKLTFPIIKYAKQEILKLLPNEYVKLVTFCENPKLDIDKDGNMKNFKSCGHCDACETAKKVSLWGGNYFHEDWRMKTNDKLKGTAREDENLALGRQKLKEAIDERPGSFDDEIKDADVELELKPEPVSIETS